MSQLPTAHLNDDQFTECALGLSANPDVCLHLANCEGCREELAQFEESVGDLKFASLEWSRSQPCVSLRVRAQKQARRPFFAIAASALAAACLLAVAIPMARPHQHNAPMTAYSTSLGAPEDSAIEIAQDNILMRDVSLAIGGNDASPLREYGITRAEVLHTSAKSRSKNQ